jgi:hypothetical protein
MQHMQHPSHSCTEYEPNMTFVDPYLSHVHQCRLAPVPHAQRAAAVQPTDRQAALQHHTNQVEAPGSESLPAERLHGGDKAKHSVAAKDTNRQRRTGLSQGIGTQQEHKGLPAERLHGGDKPEHTAAAMARKRVFEVQGLGDRYVTGN